MNLRDSTPPTRGLSIAVVDDHEVIHAGIHLWCAQARPPVRLIANAAGADEFLQLDQSVAAQIDVVSLDLELASRRPDFIALERILEAGHRVVVYSHLVDDEIILRCLDLGATAFITKNEGRMHLLQALREAADDRTYVGPRMAGALSTDQQSGRPQLTHREVEALIAWFQTESKDLVAQQLSIAPATVKTYLQRARTKYAAVGRAAPTKAALVARAIQDGIVSVNDL